MNKIVREIRSERNDGRSGQKGGARMIQLKLLAVGCVGMAISVVVAIVLMEMDAKKAKGPAA